MRHLAAEQGLALHIESAGTGDWHVGSPPDARAITAAAKVGVDISAQRAQQVVPAHFEQFTHILAMDTDNLANLMRLRPATACTAPELLLNFTRKYNGKSLSDPYYGQPRDFDETVRLVKLACEGLIAHLKK